MSTDVPKTSLMVEGQEFVKWHDSSIKKVRRGFCSECGSSLFWEPLERDWIGVAMGAFEGPTHTSIAIHVHVAEKGDYYGLEDGIPQHQP